MKEDRLLDLRYWMTIVSRHRWMIVGCALGVASLAMVFSLRQTPIYRSICTLHLKPPKVKTLTFEDIYTQERGRPSDNVLTQIQIMQSTLVVERAVRDLEDRGALSFDSPGPPRTPTWTSRAIDLLPWREENPEPLKVTPDMKRDRYVARLKRRLVIEPIGAGSFVRIAVSDRSPVRAAQLANGIAISYVSSTQELMRRNADEAVTWLNSKLAEEKTKLLDAEERLRETSGPTSPTVDDVNPLVVRELTLLQEGLMNLRLRIMEAEAVTAVTGVDEPAEEGSAPLSPTEGLEAEVAAALRDRVRAELINTSVELDQLRQRLGDRHPDVIQTMNKKKRLEDQLANLPPPAGVYTTVTSSGDPDGRVPIELLRAQEKILSDSYENAIKTISSHGESGSKAELLRHEVEVQRRSYSQLLSRLNEIILAAKLDSAVAEVFEKAVPLPQPISPNHQRTLILAVIGGLILGLGTAVMKDYLDQSVRDPGEAHDLMNAPVLGMIPYDTRKQRLRPGGPPPVLSWHGDGESQIEEAYQILRSHIEGAVTNGDAAVILVTSAVAGEGKSTTAANLAAAFADAGDRILLVDGDFRRPSLGRYFQLDLKADLTDVLHGRIPPEGAIHRDESSILDIIGTRPGGAVPQGARLTQTFESLFKWAREHYDRVIVDMPVIMVPISAEVSRAGAATVLVHRPGFASVKVLTQVREHLTLSKMPLMGIILNGVRMQWLGANYQLLYPYYSSSARTPRDPNRRPSRQLTE